MNYLVLCAGILLFLQGCSSTTHPPLKTVNALNLESYGGLWYEIARYENRFEKGCQGATAHYTLTPDHIEVINRCYADGVLIEQAEGKAYAVEQSDNSKLKVTFFWPFYGDYWVVMLADDYRYSVIGDPSRKYFWILSRSATLIKEDKEAILSRMPAWGYDPNKLFWTDPEAMVAATDDVH